MSAGSPAYYTSTIDRHGPPTPLVLYFGLQLWEKEVKSKKDAAFPGFAPAGPNWVTKSFRHGVAEVKKPSVRLGDNNEDEEQANDGRRTMRRRKSEQRAASQEPRVPLFLNPPLDCLLTPRWR